MSTRLDIGAEAFSQRALDHQRLQNNQCPLEHEATFRANDENTVLTTIIKILAVIAGIFLTLASIASLRPEMMFISITLTVIGAATIFAGAEKIADAISRIKFPSFNRTTTYSSPDGSTHVHIHEDRRRDYASRPVYVPMSVAPPALPNYSGWTNSLPPQGRSFTASPPPKPPPKASNFRPAQQQGLSSASPAHRDIPESSPFVPIPEHSSVGSRSGRSAAPVQPSVFGANSGIGAQHQGSSPMTVTAAGNFGVGGRAGGGRVSDPQVVNNLGNTGVGGRSGRR